MSTTRVRLQFPRRLAFATASLALGLAARPAAFAAVIVTSCPFTCNTNCELNGNVTCTGTDGITLNSGASLDFKGFNLICDEASGYVCGTAINITGSGSRVTNTLATPPEAPQKGVVGVWDKGISCNNQPGSTVLKVKLRGFWFRGAIDQCHQVNNNVVAGVPLPGTGDLGSSGYPVYTPSCIAHKGVDSTDNIQYNYLDGCNVLIMRYPNAPDTAVSIINNVLNIRDNAPGVNLGVAGIKLAGPNPRTASVVGNRFTGDNPNGLIQVFPAGSSVTFDDNRCAQQLPGCVACIGAYQCSSFL